jgi:5-oxoprolinase (ATP-hydrolysing)/N-methylhydantoinase A
MSAQRYRVGFDIGGTFTDFILYDHVEQAIRIHKALTTATDPWRGAIDGIHALLAAENLDFGDLSQIVHGTTLVTNAIIEGKGAQTGLLTTRGFRDVMESGREQRYDIYDLFLQFPKPLIARGLRREISERILARGDVRQPLALDEVRSEARSLVAQGVTSVAVCFLHSYQNASHERQVGELLAREFPELSVSLSCEVAPEIREYERVCTTAANAFVRPLIDDYIRTLESQLRQKGFEGQLFMMLSSGGLVSADVARRFPIRLLESGPAGGALATSMISHKLGRPDIISFDMGGTTAKTAMVRDHAVPVAPMMEVARTHRFKKGSGIPIRSPVVDMIEIGAGGGSIAYLDAVNLLKVGPESASSDPGPVCYGLGGTRPTVTDASVVLGYLDPGAFLGGRMSLDITAATSALADLGKGVGLDAARTAWGIHTLVCENMAAAARSHIIEKGCDPRAFAMVAFGGAGPGHAVKVAKILGVKEVIVPPASGAASAFGFLTAPPGFEAVRSAIWTLDDMLDFDRVGRLLEEIGQEARIRLADAHVPAGAETVERFADMRLKGQLHEISVPLPERPLDGAWREQLRDQFVQTYEALYQSVPPQAAIEVLSWRVRVSGPAPEIDLAPASVTHSGATGLKGRRNLYFGAGFVDAVVYDRYALRPGDRILGPAAVEEKESTTIVSPGDVLVVDESLNLCIAIGQEDAAALDLPRGLDQQEMVRRIEADPVGLEIMWGRLASIIDEIWDTVCRTAFSLIISDAQDFSVALFDSEGEILVHSPRAQPVFNLSLPRAIKAVLERFPGNQLQPGDVLITNDPWLASGHLYDCAVVTPVFRDGVLIGHVGTIGHVTNIGGTKRPNEAYELYEEGLQIPPMKLLKAGLLNEDLVAILRANVRDADMVVADLQALASSSNVGARRLQEFLAEYCLPDLSPLGQIFHDRSETAMREVIRGLPNGKYESEVSGLIGSNHVTVPVVVVIDDDAIELDFAGAPPEIARGGYNCTLNYATSHALFPLKSLLTPGIRSNSGCYRPLSVRIPEGTLLNCRRPASVSSRQATGWFLNPNIMSAISPAMPDKVRAFSGMPTGGTLHGVNRDGEPCIGHLVFGGGQGASGCDDGRSALLFPIGGTSSSIELLELRVQVVVERKQFDTDSGGPGQYRGGLGQVVRLSKVGGDNLPLGYLLLLHGEDMCVPSMFGGQAGAPVSASIVNMTGPVDVEGEITNYRLLANDESIEIRSAGGHGYGDPLARDLSLVECDLAGDYVTRAQAEAAYGCVFTERGELDRPATLARRALLANQSPVAGDCA